MNSDPGLNEYKKIVGKRIKLARKAAGYKALADLSKLFPDWGASRLGNYEAGVSLPNPLDLMRLSKAIVSNPCWIYFEIGSMQSVDNDIDVIRHMNFVWAYNQLGRSDLVGFRKMLKLKPKELVRLLTDPGQKKTATLCRKVEKYFSLGGGYMDKIHKEVPGISRCPS